MSTKELNSEMNWQTAISLAIFIGVILRIWAYAQNPSLWVDEAALARNILDRDLGQLFTRLDFAQIAPVGFLITTKLITLVFGISEYALRLIPLTLSIASLFLFQLVARQCFKTQTCFAASFIFAIATPFYQAAAHFKQYSSDIFICLVILLASLNLKRLFRQPRLLIFLAIIPIFLISFSLVAIFMLPATILLLLKEVFKLPAKDQKKYFFLVLFWILALLINISNAWFNMTDIDRAYFHFAWNNSFVDLHQPLSWFFQALEKSFGMTDRTAVLDGTFHFPFPKIFIGLTLIGTFALVGKSKRLAFIILTPLVMALLAASLKLYPFGARVNLFHLVIYLILFISGLEFIAQRFTNYLASWLPLLIILLSVIPLFQAKAFPKPEHLRPVIQNILSKWQEGDVIWVYYGAGQAFKYYQHRLPINGKIIFGKCNRSNPKDYLYQIDQLRGNKRVWILISHGAAFNRFDEPKLITDYLNTIGTQLSSFNTIDTVMTKNGSASYLYDLSNYEQALTSKADDFSITGIPTDTDWTCYGTMVPELNSGK